MSFRDLEREAKDRAIRELKARAEAAEKGWKEQHRKTAEAQREKAAAQRERDGEREERQKATTEARKAWRKLARVRELPEWCREEARLGAVTNPQRAFRMVAERIDAILDDEEDVGQTSCLECGKPVYLSEAITVQFDPGWGQTIGYCHAGGCVDAFSARWGLVRVRDTIREGNPPRDRETFGAGWPE